MQYKDAHQIHARARPLSPSSRQQVGALASMYENEEARELSVGRLGGLEQHGIIAYIREQFQLPRAVWSGWAGFHHGWPNVLPHSLRHHGMHTVGNLAGCLDDSYCASSFTVHLDYCHITACPGFKTRTVFFDKSNHSSILLQYLPILHSNDGKIHYD